MKDNNINSKSDVGNDMNISENNSLMAFTKLNKF